VGSIVKFYKIFKGLEKEAAAFRLLKRGRIFIYILRKFQV
jgi:hypothetical protein